MQGVSLERLPPERRITAPAAASAGSCCCCCCCCLHTVGSVIGALTAKAPKVPENPVPTAAVGELREPAYRVTKEYWVTVLLLTLFGFPLFVFIASDFKFPDGSLGEWGIVYALVFPAIQLAASIICAIRNAASKREGKEQRLQHLGSITVRAFIGGLLGILVMAVLFGALK